MNTGNGQRPNQHVGRVQQQIPTNPNLCQFQYVGMPLHHQALKNNQFSPNQARNHGYIGQQQTAGAQTGPAAFPVATFPTADIANFNQMGPPRPAMQYKNMNNWTNSNPQNNMALPSFGSLWSHFQQQQHNKQNIQQQPPQHLNQQVAYLPSQPQQQFISNADGIAFCGSPNLQQYGINQSSGTLNQTINYGGFVINRLPQAGQNPQILNACPSSVGLAHHPGIVPTITPTGMIQSNLAQTAQTKTVGVTASSNQVTTPTTTVTLTCSTSAQVMETATVHSRIPVSSVISPTGNTVKQQSAESDTSCKETNHADAITSIKVPFGWKRIVENDQVVYFSPSSIKLCNKQEVCNYLLLDETCKCGLECPLLVDKVFNFDVCVVGQSWNVEDVSYSQDLSKLCNHSRKMIAMAKFQHSQSMSSSATARSESCSSQGDDKADHSDVENTKVDQSCDTKPNCPSTHASNHISSTQHKPFGTSLIDTCTQSIVPPTAMVHNHRMPKFQDVPRMNPFEVATKPRPVRKRKPKVKKSQTPDPAADLGPITCHVPQKLDFSQESHLSYRFKVDQMNCHMQPSLSPNDYQQGLVSPQGQGLLSPQNLVSPSNVFSAQNQGMKGPVVFQNSASVCAVPSGHFLEQVPTSAMNTSNLQSQFQLPVNIQSNTGVMFQQLMPAVHNPVSPRLANDAMYSQNNPYQQNILCNTSTSGYVYPQTNELMWLEAGKPKSKRPRGKKDKHKLNSIVDRTSPCPNVDVRNLGTKTPDLTSEVSFLENPTAFLAQQTVLVNNSIKSPLTQSKDLPPCNVKTGDGGGIHNTPSTASSSWKKITTTSPQTSSISLTSSGSKSEVTTSSSTSTSPNKQNDSPASNTVGGSRNQKPNPGNDEGKDDLSPAKEREDVEQQQNPSVNESDVEVDKKCKTPVESKSVVIDGQRIGVLTNDVENHGLSNLHQIIVSTEQNDFPASNLLSAAARAQITQQQSQNLLGHNTTTLTNTVTDNSNVNDWMNKIVLANNGTTNMPLDQHIHIMLQQNPNFLASGSGGFVNTINGVPGMPLNMFFPLGQPVDPSSLSPSNFLVNVNQQVSLMKSDASNTSTVLAVPQEPNTVKTSNVQNSNQIQTAEIVTTDQAMASINAPMPRISVPLVSNVTNSISQVIPTVGVTQPIINQQPITAQMLGGMTFPAMNNLFVANTITPNHPCSQNLTLMDIVQSTDQTKAIPKASPTTIDNMGIAGNMSAAINQDVLSQASKNEQLANNGNPQQQQLLFLPNVNVPMMQVLGSNPYVQQGELEKLSLQSTPQYMVPNAMVDPTGQFCTNQQNQAGLLGLLGMQQMWGNLSTNTVGNMSPAQLQQVQLQQLLFQQLQGMQTLINLQTVSQPGLDNSGQQQSHGVKNEPDGVDGSDVHTDVEGSQSEMEDAVKPEVQGSLDNKKTEKPRRNLPKANLNAKNVNKKLNVVNAFYSSESNHVSPLDNSNLSLKKVKYETGVSVNKSGTNLKNHSPDTNCVPSNASDVGTNHTGENHIAGGCAKTEPNANVNHSDYKSVRHYNGEITVVNTSSLKRARDSEMKEGFGDKDVKLSPSRSFNHGDLVWGDLAGSNWPGKLVNCNNHITADGNHTNGEEKVLVKWFGNCGESKVDLMHLKSWSEGLMAYQQTQQTKNKRERNCNETLEKAIKEALLQEPANELPLMVRANKKKKV